jgi:hypothetical protein
VGVGEINVPDIPNTDFRLNQGPKNDYMDQFKDSYLVSNKVKSNPYYLVMDKNDFCSPNDYQYSEEKCFQSLNHIEKATIIAVKNSDKTKVLNLNPFTWVKALFKRDFSDLFLEIDLQEPFIK